jgi:hypothetical protein
MYPQDVVLCRNGTVIKYPIEYSKYRYTPKISNFEIPPDPPIRKNFANFSFAVKKRVKKFHSSTNKIILFLIDIIYLIYNILSLNKYCFCF